MRSALTAIRWRARSASLLRTRFVLFIDNHPFLAVLVKSRSSSRKLNAVARETAVILLCTLSRPLYAYTDTDRNPADAGSRRRHATTEELPIARKVHHAAGSVVLNNTHATSPAISSPRRISTTIACTVADALSVARMQSPRSPPGFVIMANIPHLTKMGLDAQLCEYLEWLWHEGAHVAWASDANQWLSVFLSKETFTSRLRGSCSALGNGRSLLCRLLRSLDQLFCTHGNNSCMEFNRCGSAHCHRFQVRRALLARRWSGLCRQRPLGDQIDGFQGVTGPLAMFVRELIHFTLATLNFKPSGRIVGANPGRSLGACFSIQTRRHELFQ